MQMKGGTLSRQYGTAILTCALVGAGLRLLLWWVNPALNAFDNHFEVVSWIIDKGSLPPKYALWESYQPPVFYVVSAVIGKTATGMGLSDSYLPKAIQFTCCLYGILTLGVVYLILNRLPLSGLSRLFAFGAVCFLPRHIYASAMLSNDTLSVLLVTGSAYLMIQTYEKGFLYSCAALTGLCALLAVFTKYTALLVFPMSLGIFVPLFLRQIKVSVKKLAVNMLLMLAAPFLIFGLYSYGNSVYYHAPLPLNDDQILAKGGNNPQVVSKASFSDFRLWEIIETPILSPGKMDSFWTLVYSSMWFDVEPKFLFLIDKNINFWESYYRWLRGEICYPPRNEMTTAERLTGSALITLGLVPLLLILVGIFRLFRIGKPVYNGAERTVSVSMQIFTLMLLFNIVGVIFLTLRVPAYSSMKALYFLNSLPAFAVFLGIGFMSLERRRMVKWAVTSALVLLFVLVNIHILHIVSSCSWRIGE